MLVFKIFQETAGFGVQVILNKSCSYLKASIFPQRLYQHHGSLVLPLPLPPPLPSLRTTPRHQPYNLRHGEDPARHCDLLFICLSGDVNCKEKRVEKSTVETAWARLWNCGSTPYRMKQSICKKKNFLIMATMEFIRLRLKTEFKKYIFWYLKYRLCAVMFWTAFIPTIIL